MKRSLRAFRPSTLLIGYCALLLASCAGPAHLGERVPPEQRRAYDAALASLPSDPAVAQTRLEAFLQEFPSSPLADDATEELARLALLQGHRDEAFDRLKEVIRKYPSGNRVDSVRVRLARWEWDQGEHNQARQLLDGVRVAKLDASDRRDLYGLLAKMSEDPVERVVHLAALRQEWSQQVNPKASSQDVQSADARLQNVDAEIDAQLRAMTWAQLLRVSEDLGREVPAGRIQLIMVWREMAGGQLERARKRLAEAETYPLSPADEQRLANLQHRLRDDAHAAKYFVPSFREALERSWPSLDGAQGTLGVVLPLSGRYASFGQAALRGILLAVNIFEAGSPEPADPSKIRASSSPTSVSRSRPKAQDPAVSSEPELWVGPRPDSARGIRLLVRDTAGQPELAAAAVRELAEDDRVLAVIGPIFSAESEAAADQAEREGIPLLSLSNRPALPEDRPWVFRLRMTPEDEVGALVEYAVDRMELSKFAILYPLNRYGRGMRAKYWDTVQAYGGQVVAVAGYEPSATDFNQPIRSLVGYDLLTTDEEIALEERSKAMRRGRRLEPEQAAHLRKILYSQLGPESQPLPPLVDFDALFIPDSHEKIQLIAPQLAFHEVDGVQLLGSSGWNNPSLVKIGRGHVDGALISTSFDQNSRAEPVEAFVSNYRSQFSEEPDEFSSGGFDAASLVLTQLVSGRDSRIQIRDGLLRIYGYPGVSGVTNIQPDGNARKRPFLLQVRRGKLRELD